VVIGDSQEVDIETVRILDKTHRHSALCDRSAVVTERVPGDGD